MADLSDKTASQSVKIVGSNETGVETDYVESFNGRLKTDVKLSKESGQVDTVGRLRVVLPIELRSYYFSNTAHLLKMDTTVAGGSTGTVALTLNKGSVTITNTTGNEHKINFSTKNYVRYSPGLTHKVTLAARVGTSKTNVERRWGIFTDLNGFYFKQTSNNLYVALRDGGAGDAVTETQVQQADWNIDKLDGTGPSGLNLNVDNHGIYFIEYDWHGAGTIRFGVKYNQEPVYCHEMLYDFTQTDTSTRSPALPVNFEILNVGNVTGNTTSLLAAVSVYKDGESQVSAEYSYSASRGVSSVTVGNGALLPLISLRPKLTFNGILARIALIPIDVEVLSASNNMYVQVILNASLTGASWASVNAESNAEYDIAATAFTGGTIIWEGYVYAGVSPIGQDISGARNGTLGVWELNVNYAGTVPDTLTVVARSLGNNNTTYAAIRWLEFQ